MPERPVGFPAAAVGAVSAAVLLFVVVVVYDRMTFGPPRDDAPPTTPVVDDATTESPNVTDDSPFRLVAISARGNRLQVTFLDGTGRSIGADVPSGWSETVPNGKGARANRFAVSTATDNGKPPTTSSRVESRSAAGS